MKYKKGLVPAFAGTLLAGSLAGSGMMAAPQTFCEATEEITTYAVYDGNTWECCRNENAYKRACAERFKIYEQFGLTYD